MIDWEQTYRISGKTTSQPILQEPVGQKDISESAEMWVLSPPPNSPILNSVNIADARDVNISLSP